MTTAPTINPDLSFMQNIMAFARSKRVMGITISKTLGISDSKLTPQPLAKNPYPSLETISIENAEAAIKLVAPEALHVEFRKLKGYPQPTIDATLGILIEESPDNPTMQSLKGECFGELFRFNREQRRRNEKYLTIANFAPINMPPYTIGTAEFSCIERGEHTIPEPVALSLLPQLGHSASKEGLKAFCLETAELIAAYDLRKTKFQRAVYAHMYPKGTYQKRLKRPHNDFGITQPMIAKETHTSTINIMDMIEGTYIPTEAQAQCICALFKCKDEEEFYAQAEAIYLANPKLSPPSPKEIPFELKEFGENIKIIREELGITQQALQWLAKGNQGMPNDDTKLSNRIISTLELGKKKLPLLPKMKNTIIEKLGCISTEQLKTQAGKIRAIQTYRDQYFIGSLQILAARGNLTAEQFRPDNNGTEHFPPQTVRDICEELNMSESEVYTQTQPTVPPDIITACDEVAQFVANFDYTAYQKLGNHAKNAAVGRRSAHRG